MTHTFLAHLCWGLSRQMRDCKIDKKWVFLQGRIAPSSELRKVFSPESSTGTTYRIVTLHDDCDGVLWTARLTAAQPECILCCLIGC